MGGDNAPRMVLSGANMARKRFPGLRLMLFGDEARLKPLLKRMPRLGKIATLHHTESVVAAEEKPSVALRAGRRSSMRLAIDAVRDGEAQGVVSAGNTGALMAMSMVGLRTLAGIDRPAMAGFFPTQRGESVMLDLGANVECSAENLIQFAIMGEVFARTVLGLSQPTVGLLNVGSEELKGNAAVRRAAMVLRDIDLPLKFHGFVEGDDIAKGTVDVVVADGFSGNIALKSAEGTARLYAEYLRQTFRGSTMAGLGYLLARRALKKLRARLDPRRYNGAVFLGLNGITVKSHGGSDALGFATAISLAVDMAKGDVIDRTSHELKVLDAEGQVPTKRAAAS